MLTRKLVMVTSNRQLEIKLVSNKYINDFKSPKFQEITGYRFQTLYLRIQLNKFRFLLEKKMNN